MGWPEALKTRRLTLHPGDFTFFVSIPFCEPGRVLACNTQQPRNSPHDNSRLLYSWSAPRRHLPFADFAIRFESPFLLWVFVLAVCEPCSAQGGWGYSSPPPGRHGALVKKMTFLFTSGGGGARSSSP